MALFLMFLVLQGSDIVGYSGGFVGLHGDSLQDLVGVAYAKDSSKNGVGIFHSSASQRKIDLNAASVGHSGGFVDLNGDGLQDLVVGAPNANASPRKGVGGVSHSNASGRKGWAPYASSSLSKGAILAFYNSDEGFSIKRSWLITGETMGDSLGYAFANVGDVDGDGYDDFAIGALTSEGEAPLSGAVYIYRGGQDGPILLARLKGNLPLDKFGYRIAGGDLNNDGKSDVIVSAVYETANAFQSGTVSIFLGGDTIAEAPDIVIRGTQPNGGSGYGLATGDVNGDNITDLFIGQGHSVFVYYGSNDLVGRFTISQEADVHINGQSEGGSGHSGHGFGDAIAFMGDVNNDGFGDFAVSNWRRSAPDSADYIGAVYIFRGSDILPHEFYENDEEYLLVKITGVARTNIFGAALTIAPDLNNGGLPDLLVSAPWAPGGLGGDQKASGRIYLFHTENLIHTTPAFINASEAERTYTADTASGEFGIALAASTGNIFFAGAPSANTSGGKAFLIDGLTGDTTQLSAD
jgi:hypothetical protein